MSTTACERLLRVLELEERQGWRNRAVIGGLQAMAERWREDALKELSGPEHVEMLTRLMVMYDQADVTDRAEIGRMMVRCLEGDTESALAFLGQAGESKKQDLASPSRDAGRGQVAIPPPEPTHIAQKRVQAQKKVQRGKAENLSASPEILPGVGSVTVRQLARLGIESIADLLWHLPTRYEDYSKLRTIAQLEPGEQATVIANLWEVTERKISMNRQMVQGILSDGTGTLRATWWNRYVKKQLTVGEAMRFSGKVGLFMGQKTLENPVFEDLDEEMVATGRIAPVYRLTDGIQNKRMRNIIREALNRYVELLPDPLPTSVRDAHDLPSLPTALRQAHFPDDQDSLDRALRRLAFEELFYLQLGVLQRRQKLREANAVPIQSDAALTERFLAVLPFSLTRAQTKVLDEVLTDMQRTVPMTRLVQGDVGSGKTVIAAAAMYTAFTNHAQSALLAPTQILAEQHYRTIGNLLVGFTRPDGTEIRVELLTGRVTGNERERIVEGLRAGTIDVVVGTTALIQETVEFSNLGFAVVDEQHRFGVEQRGALRSKGVHPHLLVMSATPIPRSLALTVYGELDVSVIDEMPPGRTPVKTKRFRRSDRERLYQFVRREAKAGRQAFIVYPLVEESEKLDASAAVDEYERLRTEVFSDLRLALLHGRMSGNEKEEVMSAFARGDYDVLVSTTVIEVGIDVPNASLIIIEDAERFGLAQLHQLRGRVGRGEHESYCALISNADTQDANERLRALVEMTSGFDLAEKDLELRGPGDFLGTRQSGLPDLRVAKLGDMETLSLAREAARSFFANNDDLAQYPLLTQAVSALWQGHGDVS